MHVYAPGYMGGVKFILDIFAMILQKYRMWISRYFNQTVTRTLKDYPAVILTGARQTGKTSLLKHIFPDYNYVSLDDPSAALQAQTSPGDFIKSLSLPVIIDEAQYAPEIFRSIKIAVDDNRKNGQFIITGSQHFSLMEKVSESMAGRCAVLNLMTLSSDEISAAKKITEEEYIIKGGYPAIHGNNISDISLWYSSYINTYLERDVRNIMNVSSLRDFNRFIRVLAVRSAQLLSYSDLARDTGISPNTAKSWISILQTSHIIYLLEPYYRNLGKRLIKSPKVYFTDTGLLTHLLGITSWNDAVLSPMAGNIWETYVFNQLFRSLQKNTMVKPELWFWQNQSGHEVDFLIEKGGRFIAVEAKMKELPDLKDTANFERLKSFYGADSLIKGYVLCRCSNPYKITKEIEARGCFNLKI